jgi:hypothetical protein
VPRVNRLDRHVHVHCLFSRVQGGLVPRVSRVQGGLVPRVNRLDRHVHVHGLFSREQGGLVPRVNLIDMCTCMVCSVVRKAVWGHGSIPVPGMHIVFAFPVGTRHTGIWIWISRACVQLHMHVGVYYTRMNG